jgi:hypothetical protein
MVNQSKIDVSQTLTRTKLTSRGSFATLERTCLKHQPDQSRIRLTTKAGSQNQASRLH